MNAADQAVDVALTRRIATLVTLFRQQFPRARADLRPWRNDADTEVWTDPASIDIAFHLPGWNPRYQCRSILMQARLLADTEGDRSRLLGIDLAGLNYTGEQWRLSTVGDWAVEGRAIPAEAIAEQLRCFCRQAFELFNHPTDPVS